MSEAVKKEPWWRLVLLGLAFIAGAAYVLWYLTDFENSTDSSRRMNLIFAMIYNFGGKYLCSGIIAGIGVIFGVLGFKKLGEDKKAQSEKID